jgi:CheY-like chemotaxis protein
MAGILIVEDERVAAWNIQSALEKFGYTVVANIGSGDKAVGLAGTLKPDLVLMDIRLPGEIDGIEAAARIRNQFKIPVVYLTAYTDRPLRLSHQTLQTRRASHHHHHSFASLSIRKTITSNTAMANIDLKQHRRWHNNH